MIHDLTAGHFDPRNVQGPVLKPIEMRVVRRLLAELGGKHADGAPTLDGWKVSFEEGCVVLAWKGAGRIGPPRSSRSESNGKRFA